MNHFPKPLLLLSPLLLAGNLQAAVVSLGAAADAYIRVSSASSNYGSDVLLVANDGNNNVRGFLISFNLSTITDQITNLRLQLVSNSAGTAEGFNVYGLTTETWVESTVTWANAPGVINSFAGTSATPSQIIDTTELYNSGAVLATFSNNSTSGSTDTFFNVGTGSPIFDFLTADSDKVITFLVVENGSPATDTAGAAWNSKESTGTKPNLTVTTIPEPSSLLIAGLGGLAFLGMRRRI